MILHIFVPFKSLTFHIDVIVSPNADAKAIIAKLESEHDGACLPLERSLTLFGQKSLVQRENFYQWAEMMVPQLSSTLSTFVHNLLFHTKYTKHHLNFVPFEYPKLEKSDIFGGAQCSNLFALAVTSPLMSGNWHNLYSFEYHGNSMNRLQVSAKRTCTPCFFINKPGVTSYITSIFFSTRSWDTVDHLCLLSRPTKAISSEHS